MKTFYVGIKGVIVRDGKLLLLRTNAQNDNRGARWEMPGGRMEDDETIHQTLTRELVEELPNIKNIKIGKLLGASRIHKDLDPDVSLVLVFYEVQADFDGHPRLSDEHLEYKWSDHKEALKLVQDNTIEAINNIFSK